MKKNIATLIIAVGTVFTAVAGNPDRAGSAGAGHLLVNPWARSAGMGYSAMASINGIEASFNNVAGLAFVNKTELLFSSSNYLVGTGIKLNAFGFGQRVGESGVLGLSVTNMNFGDLEITEEDLPEGGIGSFSPTYTNIGMSYAKAFSNSIYGGITVRLISEAIYNVRSQGVSFDAGIRYVTGENDNIRFGISLRSVGPPMRYRGDGMTITATIPNTLRVRLRVAQAYDKFRYNSGDVNDLSTAQNTWRPLYRFSTKGIAPVLGDVATAEDALSMINVVPNPYYAFSLYETSKLDNRIKITNLPEECV